MEKECDNGRKRGKKKHSRDKGGKSYDGRSETKTKEKYTKLNSAKGMKEKLINKKKKKETEEENV